MKQGDVLIDKKTGDKFIVIRHMEGAAALLAEQVGHQQVVIIDYESISNGTLVPEEDMGYLI